MRECPRCEACYEDVVVTCPDDATDTKHTLPGPALLNDRYLLVKRIGRGAMGQVYLARDQNLVTRRVAVKTVRPDILSDEDMQEGEAIARFEREARAAASIQHPNIVDVTDFGKSPDGVFFLVMEYVEGETLHQLLRREGTLNLKRTASLLGQIVAGVEAAHDRSILHRDLKPANIFIMQQLRRGSAGDDGFVKVGDFGLASTRNIRRRLTVPPRAGLLALRSTWRPNKCAKAWRSTFGPTSTLSVPSLITCSAAVHRLPAPSPNSSLRSCWKHRHC
jgi:serine/threonine-protein kinase